MIGQVIGSYRVTRQLGQGGMGKVYEVSHITLARKAAVKVLHTEVSSQPEIVARFINEAKATNIIAHQDIVDIFELGTLPSGEVFILMEFLDGESLRQRLRRLGRLDAGEALSITKRVAIALAAAHDKGIVHRDLKPDNVMLLAASPKQTARGGEASGIKLLDFGIAKLAAEHAGPGGALRTGTGVMLGTPTYMSPEQCRGAGGVDYRTDVYALGVMLFEMLQGRPPFTGAGVGDLIVMHMTATPPPMQGVPSDLCALVMRMLAKQPEGRPAMAEVVNALSRLPAPPPKVPAKRTSTPVRSVVPSPVVNYRPPTAEGPPAYRPLPSAAKATSADTPSAAVGAVDRKTQPPRSWWLAGAAALLLVGFGVTAKLVQSGTRGPGGRTDPDIEAVTTLADIDGDLLARRWDDAAQKADGLLRRPEIYASRREAAATKKERAEAEKRNQDIYKRFSKAGGSGNYDDALKIYRTLAADSVYRQVAKEEHDKMFPLFVSNHLQKADTARRSGDCTTAQAEVDQVLAVEPRHLQALSAREQPCGKLGTRPPPPTLPERLKGAVGEPPRVTDLRNPFGKSNKPEKPSAEAVWSRRLLTRNPFDESNKPEKGASKIDETAKPEDESAASQAEVTQSTVEKKLDEAQRAYIDRDYAQAIEIARPLTGSARNRSWLIIAVAACGLKDLRLASDAYGHLGATSRQFVTSACQRHGIFINGTTVRLSQ